MKLGNSKIKHFPDQNISQSYSLTSLNDVNELKWTKTNPEFDEIAYWSYIRASKMEIQGKHSNQWKTRS